MAWPVIVLAVLLTGATAYFTATHLKAEAGVDKMLSRDLPFRKTEAAIGKAFPLSDDVLSVVVEADDSEAADNAASALAARLATLPERFSSVFYPEGLPFFRRNGLLYLSVGELEQMSGLLAKAQPLLSTLGADPTLRGITDILSLAIEQGDNKAAAAVGPALGKMAAAVRSLEEGRDARLSWRSLLDSGGDNDVTATRKYIAARPVLDQASLDPVSPAIDAIASAATALKLDESRGIRVRVTGNSLMLQEELQAVRQNAGIVGLLSFGLVIALLAIGLRSLRLVVATAATLVVGLAWTAAFAVAAFGALNIISVAFAVLFMGLSVDFGIHVALRYREASARSDHRDALKEAGKSVGPALLLSAVTAAISFLSFLATDYRGMAELGVVSGVGVFVALFLNLTLLPALLNVMPVRGARPVGRPAAASQASWYQALMRRHALGIVIVAGVLGVIATTITPYAWFDDDPLNLRDPNSPAVQTLLDLIKDPRTETYSAALLAPSVGAAERMAMRFKALPQVKSAATVKDLIPTEQDRKRAIIGDMAVALAPLPSAPQQAPSLTDDERSVAFERLRAILTHATGGIANSARNLSTVLDRMPRTPDALRALEQALLSGFPPFRERLAALLDPETVGMANLPAVLRERRVAADGRALVTINPKKDLREPAARLEFVDAVRGLAPEASGPPIRFTAVGDIVVGAFREAAIIAGVLIVLLLFAVLRRILDVLFVLAPIALAIVMTVALTVLFKTPFNVANIVVLPLILGLGVAFGIQIVMRHRDETDGAFMESPTPRAIVFSALTTIGAFGSLALSSHPGIAGMGFLLLVSITLTMLSTLLVLPALLELPRRGKSPKSEARKRPSA